MLTGYTTWQSWPGGIRTHSLLRIRQTLSPLNYRPNWLRPPDSNRNTCLMRARCYHYIRSPKTGQWIGKRLPIALPIELPVQNSSGLGSNQHPIDSKYRFPAAPVLAIYTSRRMAGELVSPDRQSGALPYANRPRSVATNRQCLVFGIKSK